MAHGVSGLTMYETATRQRSKARYTVDSIYDMIAAVVKKTFVFRRCRISHMQRLKSTVYAPVRRGVDVREGRAKRRKENDQ